MPDNGTERILDAAILEMLQGNEQEMTPDEVESKLADSLGETFDTFAVRRAIWRLVLTKKAILTPQHTVRTF